MLPNVKLKKQSLDSQRQQGAQPDSKWDSLGPINSDSVPLDERRR